MIGVDIFFLDALGTMYRGYSDTVNYIADCSHL